METKTLALKIIQGLACSALCLLLLAGCAKPTKVSRLDAGEARDLSGAWNDTDSQLVSEEMIQDVLTRPWLGEFRGKNGKAPVVVVGEVNNLSHEHINVNTFVRDMERALINSGQVQAVASRQERDIVREERSDQAMNASAESAKAMGQETGADFVLTGSINTILDVLGSTQVRFYQVDLGLIDMTNNRKVWLGQKKIKKLVERSKLRY